MSVWSSPGLEFLCEKKNLNMQFNSKNMQIKLFFYYNAVLRAVGNYTYFFKLKNEYERPPTIGTNLYC